MTEVADYTGAPEILGGRVKSLHPKIHGGILAVRGNEQHELDMEAEGVKPIDMVVGNLYPFEETVKSGADFDTAIENIDIGGPTMLRAAAKNNAAVAVLTEPQQYKQVMEEMTFNSGSTTRRLRKALAMAAFSHSSKYEQAISNYFASADGDVDELEEEVHVSEYKNVMPLKYGCNPHQSPAAMCAMGDQPLPFEVLNGTPGYINLLDAINAWQLVRELKIALGLPAATSFKHVSPAGAALAVPLDDAEKAAYEVGNRELTPASIAYLRARNADPMCSFGDFAALSDVVDVATAKVLKTEVSDGIIAPGYEPEALAILSSKKGGNFIVLQADENFEPPAMEFREIFGMGFMQKRNDVVFDHSHVENVVTSNGDLPEDAARDLILGSIAIKYTQSNSVGYAKNGMMLGIGAGQQSRVDCVKLAGRKVETWWMRQHPKVMNLNFREGVKRQARVNARVRYIEGDFTDTERPIWEENFTEVPEPLTAAEKQEWMDSLNGVGLCSDAFFPFRDGIDHASKYGVQFVSQPGGSIGDPKVIEAVNNYGMTMAMSGLRLFHH